MSIGYWSFGLGGYWVLGIGVLDSVGIGYWVFKLAPIPIDWGQKPGGMEACLEDKACLTRHSTIGTKLRQATLRRSDMVRTPS